MRDSMVTEELKLEIISWVKTVIYALLFALAITNFVIVNAKVPSGSMENTIMTGDRMVAFRLAYLFKAPERFDIVVFRFPDDETQLFVKRIVGLPGETIEVKEGEIYINGSDVPLADDFVKEKPIGSSGPFTIPEGHYFMMGDNRNDSNDSREWNLKYVKRSKILGKAIFEYYPKFNILKDNY